MADPMWDALYVHLGEIAVDDAVRARAHAHESVIRTPGMLPRVRSNAKFGFIARE